MKTRAWVTAALAAGVLIPLAGGSARAADPAAQIFNTPQPAAQTTSSTTVFTPSSTSTGSGIQPQIARPAPEPSTTAALAIGSLFLLGGMLIKRRAPRALEN